MRIITFLALFLLFGCNTTSTSDNIAQNTIKEVVEVKRVVEQIERSITPECKNDLLMTQLQTISTQTDSIKSQVESISIACNSEKNILQEKIRIREFIIACIVLFLVLLIILRVWR